MSLGKTLLIGAAGLAAGLLIAAWAESMNESDSNELDLDDPDETVENETDETLKESGANA
jgi:hypothetical protein